MVSIRINFSRDMDNDLSAMDSSYTAVSEIQRLRLKAMNWKNCFSLMPLVWPVNPVIGSVNCL